MRSFSRATAALVAVLGVPGDLRRVLLTYGQSTLGDAAGNVALLLVAYERLHSPWAISTVLIGAYAPRIVIAPIAGVLADTVSRRPCVVGADLLRAAAMIGLALIGSFPVTAALAVAVGAGNALYRPVAAASMRTLAGPELQDEAAAARSLITNIALGLGPALAAGLLAIGTPGDILLVDAATFIISAAILAGVRLDAEPHAHTSTAAAGLLGRLREAARAVREAAAGLLGRLREGGRAVRDLPGLADLLVTVQLVLLAGGMMSVAEPLLAKNVLHGGDSGFAALSAAVAIGFFVGSYSAADTPDSAGAMRRGYLLALGVASLGLFATSIAPTLLAAALASVLTGIGNDYSLTRQEQLLQHVPGHLLGRVFGFKDMAGGIALTVAYGAGGAVTAAIGPRAVIALAAGGIAVAALVGARRLRLIVESATVPQPAERS